MYPEKKKSLLKSKLLYTLMIMLIYLLGKGLPLYGIDISAYLQHTLDTGDLLVQTISGDINKCSLFALGISPYMLSSLTVMIISLFQDSETQKRTSPKRKNRLILMLTLVVALFMAIANTGQLHFDVSDDMLALARVVVICEMVAGAFLILFMASSNQKYGIGGQSALIFLNILDGIMTNLQGQDIRKLTVPLLIALFVMLVVLVMENAEKRIPLQRISIHNIYADKNYLAIKLNPIGVMPAMFSAAVFMLPQLVITFLTWVFPQNTIVLWWEENMTLDRPLGIGTYVVILFALTIGFSRAMINPNEMTDMFLKSGDSIRDIHAGRDTTRYLSGVITRLSLGSAIVMSVCLCIPMLLQMRGEMQDTFPALISSVMILTGVWCNLSREIAAIRDLEAYRPFL